MNYFAKLTQGIVIALALTACQSTPDSYEDIMPQGGQPGWDRIYKQHFQHYRLAENLNPRMTVTLRETPQYVLLELEVNDCPGIRLKYHYWQDERTSVSPPILLDIHGRGILAIHKDFLDGNPFQNQDVNIYDTPPSYYGWQVPRILIHRQGPRYILEGGRNTRTFDVRPPVRVFVE